MRISRIDRIPAVVDLTATNPDGTPATVGTVSVAALGLSSAPSLATTWTAATATAGQVPLTLAGPDATTQAGDFVLPAGDSILWVKDAAADHTQAVSVGHISVQ